MNNNLLFVVSLFSVERRGKSLLDDERFLETIEASFKQFYQFLDLLKGKGYMFRNTTLFKPLQKSRISSLLTGNQQPAT